MSPRTVRVTALLMPSPLAAAIARRGDDARLVGDIALALGVLWIVMAASLIAILIAERRRPSPASRIDVLTATGASMMYGGTISIIASGIVGWASLAVVGTLGMCAVMLAVVWSLVVAGRDRPWAGATIVRELVPARSVEGDPLREQITISRVTIPVGMRLFVQGRAMRHGAMSRHVVDSEASGGQVALTAELGPALRGDHVAQPLALWLGDVLGLTRTPAIYRCETEFSVVPRVVHIDGVDRVLGPGGDDAISTPAAQMPTEGTFRIREYAQGDDTRRIHWVRSLQQNQLVVRLPDEIPPAEPAVRVILDNELRGADALTTRAVDELLDGLVRVWIGVGASLAAGGTRVTLVTAIGSKRVERTLNVRGIDPSVRLGAAVAWQAAVPLASLVDERVERRAIRQIVVSSRPRRVPFAIDVAWIIVPESAWTSPEPDLVELRSATKLSFPLGSEENRGSRRKRERQRVMALWNDRTELGQMLCWTDWSTYAGNHVASLKAGRVALKVIR